MRQITVVISGGDVDTAEAAAIQSISGYDGSAVIMM